MTDDAQGNLYISVYSKGLYIYNVESGKVTVLNMQQRGDKGFLCNDWVRSMALDHTGHLWIGTSNGVPVSIPERSVSRISDGTIF